MTAPACDTVKKLWLHADIAARCIVDGIVFPNVIDTCPGSMHVCNILFEEDIRWVSIPGCVVGVRGRIGVAFVGLRGSSGHVYASPKTSATHRMWHALYLSRFGQLNIRGSGHHTCRLRRGARCRLLRFREHHSEIPAGAGFGGEQERPVFDSV